MEKEVRFQRNEISKLLCKVAACGLIPIVSCLLYCAFQGQSLSSIYLPGTENSDEIFYYKMVEGAVKYGSPLGYFGYNESHAMVSSFGAWSPVLLVPWILWGKVFGWGYFSPVICNICILSFGFCAFAALAKPTWKQILSISVLFLCVTPFTRYILSGMAETVCHSLIIIMFGILYSYFKDKRIYKLILLFVLITFLSLMRPYFMVFLLLPGILWIRRSKLGGSLGSTLILALNLTMYKIITYYFTCPYYETILDDDFIEMFRNEGFSAGCQFLFHKVYDKWMAIRWYMSLGVRQGQTEGQIYFACCFVMLLLFIWLLADIVKIKRQDGYRNEAIARNVLLESNQLLSYVGMLFAVIVMYPIPEGGRHMLTFLVGFMVIVAMRDGSPFKKNILAMVVFVYLFVVKYDDTSGYRVPFSEEGVVQEVENWSSLFSSCISLNYADTPNYDNVVDWVIADIVDDDQRDIPWKVLFALPEGTGISCCLPQYIKENIDGLNSRYIIAVPGGQIDLLCQEKEMDVLLSDEYFVLYQNY